MNSQIKARISLHAGEQIYFDESQWKSIEKAYGHALSRPIRARILLNTAALMRIESTERNAAALEKMIASTTEFRDAGRLLLNSAEVQDLKAAAIELLMNAGRPMKEDASWASIVEELSNPELQFLAAVDSMVAGCDLMPCNWESNDGPRKGRAWYAWVRSIIKLMEGNGLPTTARKDNDTRKPGQEGSKFLVFLDELQKHLPKDIRRHEQSLDALAAAIHRARKPDRWPALIPPRVEREFSVLETSDERKKSAEEFNQQLRNNEDYREVRPGVFQSVKLLQAGLIGSDDQKEDRNRRDPDPDPGVE